MKKKVQNGKFFKVAELLFFILILISGISLAFNGGGFVINLKKVGFTAISSVEKGFHFVIDGVKNTVNSISELRQLQKDYDALLIKLENYEQMQRSNADIRKENERLKEQLDFSISMEEKNIPAQIISRDLDSAYSYLTIDKGSVNGINKNMPVLAFQNGNQGLVGKVVQVGLFTSQVMPVYNIDCIVSCRIQQTRDLGLVSGTGNQEGPLMLNYIRKKVAEELKYGDIIVTSGENNNYMKDIPIGSISKIIDVDYDSSLKIELNPIIDFSRLENVIVVNQKEINDRKEEKY